MEIEGKILKQGNSYAIRIRKALVDCKIFEVGKTYKFEVKSSGGWILTHFKAYLSNLRLFLGFNNIENPS